ncbi:HAMP domain-containing sensor histidine kinase [Campylobacter sp. 19-13652]|uniref:HAMP domain-containing sensor histidine kinase n=1 Tax=Campylobacter sp. 19-13652 TaxID=2840180 RepID=UPI001C76C703|nr:HAMP domain-containing sensor histidine kinase [Campylobacter sp. 19-13652]BCX78962.1 hypothetical protein LBC_04240 [Campylobacter sp. 19-13652]
MLVAIITVMLYYYIRVTIYESVVQELKFNAEILTKQINLEPPMAGHFTLSTLSDGSTDVEIVAGVLAQSKPHYKFYESGGRNYLVLYHPYVSGKYLRLSRDATLQKRLIDQILVDIIIVSASALFLIVFYALFLSRMLLVPVRLLSARIVNINEHFLQEIDLKGLPVEFKPLGKSINKLIGRIKTFVGYQKELFIGVAHELKTPLAVMKTKNEVTLIKPRESEKYIEALRANNEAINSMNAMIGSILEIGRQEGAQFEEPREIDIVAFLTEMANNFKILAHQEKKHIKLELMPSKLKVLIQPTLLMHIIQNFVQNAIKFSPEQSDIIIKSSLVGDEFRVMVLDNGKGIDESADLFAPFKRYGNKPGAGLGLFLAKGAADALGATVSLKNRKDSNGAEATLIINIQRAN